MRCPFAFAWDTLAEGKDEHGQSAYFLGNRIAIESAMHDVGSGSSQERNALRLVKFDNAFTMNMAQVKGVDVATLTPRAKI